jgi:hypothetical protein
VVFGGGDSAGGKKGGIDGNQDCAQGAPHTLASFAANFYGETDPTRLQVLGLFSNRDGCVHEDTRDIANGWPTRRAAVCAW